MSNPAARSNTGKLVIFAVTSVVVVALIYGLSSSMYQVYAVPPDPHFEAGGNCDNKPESLSAQPTDGEGEPESVEGPQQGEDSNPDDNGNN